MSKKLKFLLNIDDANYRVFVEVKQNADSVSFNEFQDVIRCSYEQFLPILDQSNYVLEIYDNDFNDYVKIDENDTIENKSKLRAKRIHSVASRSNSLIAATNEVHKSSCEDSAVESMNEVCVDAVDSKLKEMNLSSNSHQPQPAKRKSVQKSKGNLDTKTEKSSSSVAVEGANNDGNENLLKLNPFFKKFSTNNCVPENHDANDPKYRLNSLLDDHEVSMEDCPTRRMSETSNNQPEQSSNGSSSRRSSSQSLEECVLKQIGKKKILKSNFIVNDFDKKLELVNILRQLVSKHSMEDNCPNFWRRVSKALEKQGIQIKYEKCRGLFMGLLGQYLNILKNLQEYTPEEAQNLWPFFKLFHYSFNLKPFKPDILLLRQTFDGNGKQFGAAANNVQYPQINMSLKCSSASYPESNCDEVLNENPIINEDEVATDSNAIERLVKAVAKNFNDLKSDKVSEDNFWRKISYEMFAYRDPLEDDSSDYWKWIFYTLLKEFIWKQPNSVGSSEEVVKLFEPLDIEFFMNTNDSRMGWFLATNDCNFDEVNTKDFCEEEPSNVEENEDETLVFQRLFLHWVRKCLKIVANGADDEKFKKYWLKVHRKMRKKGYEVDSEANLPTYLNQFIAVYYKTLKTCKTFEEAKQCWPMFDCVHAIDISPFVENVDYYQLLRKRFDQ